MGTPESGGDVRPNRLFEQVFALRIHLKLSRQKNGVG